MVINYLVVAVLVIFSGLFSGLTLGLMSLNPYALQRKVKLGDKSAEKIYPLRKRGNQLLTTLLLGNVLVNSIIAVFLGSITTGVVATILSTGLIVILGEIIPQAVFSRYALQFGAKMAWLVTIFFYVLYPFTKPIAYLLDKALGGELPTVFSKQEFRLFLEQQKTLQKSDIQEHEFVLLERGLIFSDKTVRDVMTPFKKTFYVKKNDLITPELLKEIKAKGHSRVPVYDASKRQVVGLLYTKDLVGVDVFEKAKASRFMRRQVHHIKDSAKLDNVLNLFKKHRVHLFMVHNKNKHVVGIITLEDVLEELVGEIVDEHDIVVGME